MAHDRYHIGIDVGGTFTDIVVCDRADGSSHAPQGSHDPPRHRVRHPGRPRKERGPGGPDRRDRPRDDRGDECAAGAQGGPHGAADHGGISRSLGAPRRRTAHPSRLAAGLRAGDPAPLAMGGHGAIGRLRERPPGAGRGRGRRPGVRPDGAGDRGAGDLVPARGSERHPRAARPRDPPSPLARRLARPGQRGRPLPRRAAAHRHGRAGSLPHAAHAPDTWRRWSASCPRRACRRSFGSSSRPGPP